MTQNVGQKKRNAEAAQAAVHSTPASYEAALSELEELVARMESGALSLEDSLAAYRRGAALVTHCQQQLETVEQQVRVLDGEILQPLSTTEVKRSADANE